MKPHSQRIALLAAVLFLAALARFTALDRLPPGWRDDELIEVDMDMRIAQGWRPFYIEEAEGHEPLYHYVHAATVALFGPSRQGYRWLGAACGLLGVALTLALGKRLLGWRAALAAGAAMAVSFWPLMYSRLGLRHIGSQPLLLLAVLAVWQGTGGKVEGEKWKVWCGLAGIGLAAGMYTYFAGRVAPLIVVVFALYMFLFHRQAFKTMWAGWLWMGILAALLFAPLGIYLAGRPTETRLQVVGKPLLELRQGNPLPVIETTLGTLGMFTWRGDAEWLYNLQERPVFDWVAGAFFYLGVILAARRWKQPRYGLLLIWLLVGLSPAFVSLPPASLGHTIAAMPAVYLLLGAGLIGFATYLSSVIAKGDWSSVVGRRSAVSSRLPTLLIAIVLFLHAALSIYDYAANWVQNRYVRFLYHADVADVARYLNEHPEIQDIAISTTAEELLLDARGLLLDLTRSRASVRLFEPRYALVLPAGADARIAVISDPLPAPHVEQFLLGQASLVDEGPITVNGPAFRLYAARQLDPAVPLLTFDHSLSLLEFQAEPRAAPGQPIRLRTAWRVEQGAQLPSNLKLFAHLLAPDGALLAAGDRLDVWPPALRPGDQFVQWNDLPAPANLAPGRYLAAVGVYESPNGPRWPHNLGGDCALAEIVVE